MSKRISEAARWIVRWEGEGGVTGIWAARRRLAYALRRVIEQLTSVDAPERELDAAAERIEEWADTLAAHPERRRYEGFSESATAHDVPEGGTHFDWSPLIGHANPLAPPITMQSDADGRVTGRVRFGTAYEGPPGSLHGGFVAAAFDEVLGYAQALTGNPGMTGTLTVRYRSPTPLEQELRFEAWVERIEGRKIFAKSTLHAGERLCAEAEGIFISVDRERFRELIAERARRGQEGA